MGQQQFAKLNIISCVIAMLDNFTKKASEYKILVVPKFLQAK